MHEVFLAEGLLEIIEASARQEGFAWVRKLRLEIGRLTGVEVEAMRFCLDSVLHGSLTEGARCWWNTHSAQAGACNVTSRFQARHFSTPARAAAAIR